MNKEGLIEEYKRLFYEIDNYTHLNKEFLTIKIENQIISISKNIDLNIISIVFEKTNIVLYNNGVSIVCNNDIKYNISIENVNEDNLNTFLDYLYAILAKLNSNMRYFFNSINDKLSHELCEIKERMLKDD